MESKFQRWESKIQSFSLIALMDVEKWVVEKKATFFTIVGPANIYQMADIYFIGNFYSH